MGTTHLAVQAPRNGDRTLFLSIIENFGDTKKPSLLVGGVRQRILEGQTRSRRVLTKHIDLFHHRGRRLDSRRIPLLQKLHIIKNTAYLV